MNRASWVVLNGFMFIVILFMFAITHKVDKLQEVQELHAEAIAKLICIQTEEEGVTEECLSKYQSH